MKPLLILLAGLLTLQPSARAIDFTLSTVKVEEDGFTHDQSYFALDARTHVGIRVPPQWTATATPASLALRLPGATGSSVVLEQSPLTPATAFQDKGLEEYRKLALASVPAGATDISMSGEKANPLPIFHWVDYEFVVDFALYGQLYRRSFLFLNLDATRQVRLTSAAAKMDFDGVHSAGYALMQSWEEAPNAPSK